MDPSFLLSLKQFGISVTKRWFNLSSILQRIEDIQCLSQHLNRNSHSVTTVWVGYLLCKEGERIRD